MPAFVHTDQNAVDVCPHPGALSSLKRLKKQKQQQDPGGRLPRTRVLGYCLPSLRDWRPRLDSNSTGGQAARGTLCWGASAVGGHRPPYAVDRWQRIT